MTNNEKKIVPFSRPFISEDEIKNVCDVLKSGWLTSGPVVKRFEENFSSFFQTEDELYAIAVNSATAGLHLALEALGIGPGDEVITTSLTFTATAEVVRYLGAEIKFVDIDSESMNIDSKKIEGAITERTKAIIPVHYSGLSCEMDEIIRIAKKHGLKIVEDAAHALPSSYKGELIGNLSTDASVFSFYANKTMTTGEGGMVLTKNHAISERIKIMRLHGIDRDAFNRYTDKSASWYYEVIAPGYKYNLTDLAAAIGIGQLEKLNIFRETRKNIAMKYLSELSELPLIMPKHNNDIHAWHLFVLRLQEDATITRNEFINHLNDNGIGTSVHYVPFHRQPYWKDRYNLNTFDFPETEKAYQSMVSIPIFSSMTPDETSRVIEVLKEVAY